MRVEKLGEGDPAVAIVGAIHGDEPCGVAAIERLLDERPPVERPVKLVVANERALDSGRRYVDADLNRAFPGDPDSAAHEERLAVDLAEELEGCLSLALHSTQSTTEPFAILDVLDDRAREVVPALGVSTLVTTGSFTDGRLIAHARTVEVECGYQGSEEAAENAHDLSRAFLRATGALSGPVGGNGEVSVFRLTERVPKPTATAYEVYAENFERVAPGEAFAAADGDRFSTEEPFYPVLMSPYGYDSVFGYKADRVDDIA